MYNYTQPDACNCNSYDVNIVPMKTLIWVETSGHCSYQNEQQWQQTACRQ